MWEFSIWNESSDRITLASVSRSDIIPSFAIFPFIMAFSSTSHLKSNIWQIILQLWMSHSHTARINLSWYPWQGFSVLLPECFLLQLWVGMKGKLKWNYVCRPFNDNKIKSFRNLFPLLLVERPFEGRSVEHTVGFWKWISSIKT